VGVGARQSRRGRHRPGHAIWNGATQVAEWRVLAGPEASSLAPAATVPWNGLDTSITLAAPAAEFAVEALDSHGHVIGSSEPVGP
jgi:hypothetical protein